MADTYPFTPNSVEWKNLHLAAILETDWSKLQERIEAVDLAIKGYTKRFGHSACVALFHGGASSAGLRLP